MTQKLTPNQLQIVNILPIGDDTPVTTRHLASILNVTTRAIRKDIEILITQHGIPIGSKREGNPGYFLIATNEQRANALRPFYAQMRAENKRMAALETIDIAGFHAKKKAGSFTE